METLLPLIIAALFEIIKECRKENVTQADVERRLQTPRLLDRIRVARRVKAPRRQQREALAYLMAQPNMSALEANELCVMASFDENDDELDDDDTSTTYPPPTEKEN